MMKSRRILVAKEYDRFTVMVPSNTTMVPSNTTTLSDKAFLSDAHNQSSLHSSFPHFSLSDKSTNGSSTLENPYNPYDLNARFNPSMAIVLIVLLGVFFFMGFFSIYVRRCASGEEDNSRRGGGGNGRMNRASHGLDKNIIESFPVFNYSLIKGLKQGKQALECAVCLSEFEDDETLRLLPKCSHAFHPDCIDMWLFSHTTCPLCRSSLVPGPHGVAQGLRFDVEALPQQAGAPLQETEQVVVVIGARNAVEERIDNQGRGTNEMDSFDAGVCRTGADQSRVYNELSTSATDSPILGIMNSLRPLEKHGQNFRRSHSTGHSLVRLGGNPDHPSEFYISTDDRYVVDFAEELIQSSKSGLHRSCSYAAFCHTGSPGLSYSQASVNDRDKLWMYPSSIEEPRPCSNPRASRGAEAESGQEFTRLSRTHFDPRINSDRWNISLHSPIFLRTFSESRAPYIQQQEMASTSSTSHDSNPQDLKAFMQSFKKGFKWLRGRDKNMASINGSEASRRSSRNAEGGGLLAYSFLM